MSEPEVAQLERKIELLEIIRSGQAEHRLKLEAKVAEQAATIAKLEAEIKSGDEICDALTAKYAECPHHPISDYKKGVSGECGCSYDHIGDICGLHAPALRAAQETVAQQAATIERLTKAIKPLREWHCGNETREHMRCQMCIAIDAELSKQEHVNG